MISRHEARRRHARHSFIAVVVLTLSAMSCGGAAGGCTGMGPIPTGRYAGTKSDNAVNIRLSANGINYINNNWQQLVDMFAPGRVMNLPFPCTTTSVPVLGTVYIADQGNAAGVGRNDGSCAGDIPANARVTITGFSLVPTPTDRIQGTLQLNIDTGKIYLTDPGTLCDLKCSLRYNSARVLPNDNRLAATVRFTIDTKWDKLLAFTVEGVNGSQICGSSGASPSPACLDAADLDLQTETGLCSILCDAADWAPIKTFVLQLVSPMLQTEITKQIDAQSCEACGTGLPACPRLPVGCVGTACTATSTCQNGICMDTASGGKCVPRFLGVEGRMGMGALLGGFGAPADAELDLSVAAGSSVSVDQGLSMGMRGGLQAVKVAPCVVPSAAPPMATVAAPNFDLEATPGSGYHVGLGISSSFLNQTFHQAHQSGALCLQLNASTVGLLNSGLFKTFLPSLGKLATRDGKDAPMMIVLRPARPPVVTVGQGTFDPVTKKPIKPLLTVTLPEVSVDFYAMIDDRYARLFTLTADIGLPLSLIFEGCDKVTPAIGDLKQLIINIRTANAEMLAEDPTVLADLIPAVIGLAEPAVASGLGGFALPQLGNFKLKVNEVKGLGNVAGTETYNHLGLYATLLPSNATCASDAPRTTVALKRSVMPDAQSMRLTGKPLPWPQAVLDVRALGKAGQPEFAYRIDDGLWTTFAPVSGDELVVSHPALLLQGLHTVHVRSRVAEDPHGVSIPVSIGVSIDWEPPEVAFTVDRAADRLLLEARDVVTPKDALQYAYRVGDGAFSDFGPARPISLSSVEQQGGVTARVRDAQGNVGEAVFRVPSVALRADAVADDLDPAQRTGCASVGGLELLGLAALTLLRRRRR